MMDFLLGAIFGAVLANCFLLAGLYLERRGFSQLKAIDKVAKEMAGNKVKILMPKSDAQVAQEEIIRRHEEKGEGTPLEEIRK